MPRGLRCLSIATHEMSGSIAKLPTSDASVAVRLHPRVSDVELSVYTHVTFLMKGQRWSAPLKFFFSYALSA
jgi:hypothetical protein